MEAMVGMEVKEGKGAAISAEFRAACPGTIQSSIAARARVREEDMAMPVVGTSNSLPPGHSRHGNSKDSNSNSKSPQKTRKQQLWWPS